jgi:hypothetical protein
MRFDMARSNKEICAEAIAMVAGMTSTKFYKMVYSSGNSPEEVLAALKNPKQQSLAIEDTGNWRKLEDGVWVDDSGRDVQFCTEGHISKDRALQIQDRCHHNACGYGFWQFSHVISATSGKPATTWNCSQSCD